VAQCTSSFPIGITTGLKGEFKTLSRKAVNVTYESAAQLKDHKVPESEQMRHIGQ
jgi:hypothetical protein